MEKNQLSGIVATHLSIDERDLFYRKTLVDEDLLSDIPEETKSVLKLMKEQVDLVSNHLVGETVYAYLDEKDKLRSTITSGKSRYTYITDHIDDDHSLKHGTNYKELMVDLIGSFKDGDIKVVELYSRHNWNYATGDSCMDQHDLRWKVSNSNGDGYHPILTSNDKESLGRILDYESDVDTYMNMLASARVIPDNKVVSTGNISVTVQDRLSGLVTTQYTNDVSEVMDLIFNNILIRMEQANGSSEKKN